MKNLKKIELASGVNFQKLKQSELSKVIGGSAPRTNPTIISHISCDDCTEVKGDN